MIEFDPTFCVYCMPFPVAIIIKDNKLGSRAVIIIFVLVSDHCMLEKISGKMSQIEKSLQTQLDNLYSEMKWQQDENTRLCNEVHRYHAEVTQVTAELEEQREKFQESKVKAASGADVTKTELKAMTGETSSI